ncbi:hypothetical protein DRO32_03935 [Candidatus Bathyarchaeota archaeon]|nr:MAG: hypothetical protein DRO32_03935 [Candidatus Bathyarchaeota archaeon]
MSSKEKALVAGAFKALVEFFKELKKRSWNEREHRWDTSEHTMRETFAHHVIKDFLKWTRERGKGHYELERMRIDIVCFDAFLAPVVAIETKPPGQELTSQDEKQLKGYVEENPTIRFAILTNGRELTLYKCKRGEMEKLGEISVEDLTRKGLKNLSPKEEDILLKLNMLRRELFIEPPPEWFEETHGEIELGSGDPLPDVFVEGLKGRVEGLASAFVGVFEFLFKAEGYAGDRLRETFKDWLAVSANEEAVSKLDKLMEEGKLDEALNSLSDFVSKFCDETAYALLGRLIFVRICEDKGLLKDTRGREIAWISGKTMTDYLRASSGVQHPYVRRVLDCCREMEKFYERAYVLNVFFDWWIIQPPLKGFISVKDEQEYEYWLKTLDAELRLTLMALNRFNFRGVDRDMLREIYQGYLPKDKRKTLGEFYTPEPVIQFILDAVGYTPDADIEDKKLLDPACGSGGFLVAALMRLREWYERKLREVEVGGWDAEWARDFLSKVRENIWGLDIHPFACLMSEMNLLFHTADLIALIREEDPGYRFEGFSIYRTDSIIPPGRSVQTRLVDFAGVNTSVASAMEERTKTDEVKRKEFDFVVGNPPYIRVDNIPADRREFYKQLYGDFLKGKWDIYVLFIRRGLEWLKPGGKLGFIVSNKFFTAEYGGPLRKWMLDERCVFEKVVDLSGVDVFEKSLPAPAIIIVRKEGAEGGRAT